MSDKKLGASQGGDVGAPRGVGAPQGVVVYTESRDFYQRGYAFLKRVALAQGILNLGLLLGLGVAIFLRPHPVYFAVTPSMQIRPVVPLSDPYVTNDGVARWGVRVIENTLDMNFSNWKQVLSGVAKDYTRKSFSGLIVGLKSSGILQEIHNNRLVLVTQPVEAMSVIQTGKINGIPVWELQGKFLLTFQGSNGGLNTKTIKATLIVQRADTLSHPSGLVIRQIVLG